MTLINCKYDFALAFAVQEICSCGKLCFFIFCFSYFLFFSNFFFKKKKKKERMKERKEEWKKKTTAKLKGKNLLEKKKVMAS